AESLLELEYRLRHLVLQERHAAPLLDRLHARLNERTVGGRERQSGDDHVAECVARHIDALPEAVHAEQHGPLDLAKTLEHLVARQAVALAQERQSLLGEPATQLTRRPQ